MTGYIIIDKPKHITSFDVVKKIRKLTGIKKVGHAGTLDPLASGVLIVCIGREATKKISQFVGLDKTYITKINLSAFSETGDAEGPLNQINTTKPPSLLQIKDTLKTFIGTQYQTPPVYSAIKVGGVRRYTEARLGKTDIALPQREIHIKSIQLEEYNWPELTITVSCSKGTYIRSLARDIGTDLNTGGYVQELQRTAIGPYTIEQAYNLEELAQIHEEMLRNFYPQDT